MHEDDDTIAIRVRERDPISVPRDRYSWDLVCPVCTRAGVADVSEDAYPNLPELHFTVDRVSDGFGVIRLGKSAVDTVIVCQNCNVAV